MKLKMILCAALAMVMLWGCAPAVTPTTPTVQPTVTPTTAPTTKPTSAPTVAPTVTPTVTPTEAPTQPVDKDFPMGYFDQITVHPFSQTEMTAALDLLNAKLPTTAEQDGVVSYETHWISFDPYGTLVSIQEQMNNAPVDGWTKEDYFARKMVFVVCFSMDVDETKSTGADYTEQLGTVTLTRQTNDGEWTIDVAACAAETFCPASAMVMPPEITKTIDSKQEYILAGYHDEAVGEYFMFVMGENNTVVCLSYYAAKPH